MLNFWGVWLRIKRNYGRILSCKCEMTIFSFENRFVFEKSLAAIWRILEMGVNIYMGGNRGIIAIVKREIRMIWTKEKVAQWIADIRS